MTELLIFIIYVIGAMFTIMKHAKYLGYIGYDKGISILTGIIWPFTLAFFIIKNVIIDDWIPHNN